MEREGLHAVLDHLEVFDQLVVRAVAERFPQGGVFWSGGLYRSARCVVRGALIEQHVLFAQRVDATEAVARTNRPRCRNDRDAERLLDFVHQVERVARRPVHLVDDGDDWNAAIATHLEQLDCLRLDALGTIDQHQCCIGSDQRAVGVFGEVLVARRVE